MILVSCKEENPVPVLLITAPADGTDYPVNDSIVVQAESVDNISVEQYKVQLLLVPPYEAVTDSTSDSIYFNQHSYMFISDVGYNQSAIHHTVQIPQGFNPGTYHLIVSMLDDAMYDEKDSVMVRIFNPADTVLPVIEVLSPAEGEAFDNLDTLRVQVVANDLRSALTPGAIVRMKATLVADFSGQASVDVLNVAKPQNDTSRISYIIPAAHIPGAYTLNITALDEFNNLTVIPVHLVLN